MPRPKTSKQNPSKQATVPDIVSERFTYDVEQIQDFLDLVFHADPPDDGNILTWFAQRMTPGFPISEEELEKRLTRSGTGVPLYYGTSTTVRDPDDDRLYNRKSLFSSFHVLVLDDIGQKVPFDKIPDDFDPTYKVETSKGSYHYGYVLEEPILVEEHAAALVQLVYDAGFSDKGGKMATKLVRLPGGINGKKGPLGQFQVRLDDMDGPLWTPETILEQIDVGVTWADVVADVDAVMRNRAAATVGTSIWSPITARMPTLSGVIDPALEWLYEQKMVKQELGDWVTILCPWSDTHTNGDLTAGYSPMGWGGPAYQNHRIFHCFHEHCQGWRGPDFLTHIANDGGPELPMTEHAMDLVRRYAYNAQKDGVWDVMAKVPHFVPMAGFKNLHPEMAYVYKQGENKAKVVAETRMFITSKARVTIAQQVYDPSTPARIIQTEEGNLLNTYCPSEWGDGEYEQSDIDMFEAFIKYLVPYATSRKFFLDWLAAKCQSLTFRGPAILMIAMAQGTGRTTLGNMVTALLGNSNVVKKPFSDVTGTEKFNSWMAKAMVITDETLAIDDKASFYRAGERLKDRIDTTPSPIAIRMLHTEEFTQMNYSSFLMFSNHADAMRLADNDRRFYVIDNPERPAGGDYFEKLNEWLENGTWARSVYRWLRQRDVNVSELLKPAQMTAAKAEMIKATKQPIDIAIEAIMELWPSTLIAQNQVSKILEYGNLAIRLGLPNPQTGKVIIRKVFRQHVMKLNIEGRNAFQAGSMTGVALWVVKHAADTEDGVEHTFVDNEPDRQLIDEERWKMPDEPYTNITEAVIQALDHHDF